MRYAASALLLVALVASAQELQVTGSNKAEYWWWQTDFRQHFENKLALNVTWGNLTGRGVLFVWEPTRPTAPLRYVDWSLEYAPDPLDLLVGTYYSTLGRGLVLRAYLDEDFRHDKSMRGGKLVVSRFKTDLTLLMGRPREILFEENVYRVVNDTLDQIYAADLTTGILPGTRIGARYLRLDRPTDAAPQAFSELYGGSASAVFGPLDFYLEFGRQWGTRPVIGSRVAGWGVYGALGLSRPGWGVNVEVMDYDTLGLGGAGYRYNDPPTPIPSAISVNRGMDERGYGATVSFSPVEVVSFTATQAWLYTHARRAGAEETVGKVKWDPNDRISLGLEFDRRVTDRIELKVNHKTEYKPLADVTYSWDGVNFVEIGGDYNWLNENGTFPYQERGVEIAYGRSPDLSLTLRYEDRSRVVERLGTGTRWLMGEVSYDISENINLRLMAGSQKGGLVCSGGVCRLETPFTGVKAVLTTRF